MLPKSANNLTNMFRHLWLSLQYVSPKVRTWLCDVPTRNDESGFQEALTKHWPWRWSRNTHLDLNKHMQCTRALYVNMFEHYVLIQHVVRNTLNTHTQGLSWCAFCWWSWCLLFWVCFPYDTKFPPLSSSDPPGIPNLNTAWAHCWVVVQKSDPSRKPPNKLYYQYHWHKFLDFGNESNVGPKQILWLWLLAR